MVNIRSLSKPSPALYQSFFNLEFVFAHGGGAPLFCLMKISAFQTFVESSCHEEDLVEAFSLKVGPVWFSLLPLLPPSWL